jgi:hypothetical protein
MTCELVQKDGDAIDATAALEMRLDLFWRGAVVDIPNEDTSGVYVLLVFAQFVALTVQASLHFSQLGRFLLHFLYASFHRRDFFLRS